MSQLLFFLLYNLKQDKEMAIVKRNFPVQGMGCAACVARVQGVLRETKGVISANVSLASNSAQVEYDTAMVKAAEIKKTVQDAGYDLLVSDDADDSDAEDVDSEMQISGEEAALKDYTKLKRTMWLSIILAVAIMIIGLGVVDFKGKQLVLFVLATLSVFVCGRRFISSAWKQLRHFSATMDTLVALSTTIAWLFSVFNMLFPSVWTSRGLSTDLYFDSCSMIVAFILIGRVLEQKARHGTTDAVRKLMGLQPKKVKASVGDIVKVKPGQRIPVDGIVTEGTSFVDESMLTGEPVAVEKMPGSKVYTGTINQKGAFKVRVLKTGNDTMLSSIIKMVKDAQGSKPRIQNIVDKVAAVFVPVIILIAIAAFCYWTFVAVDGGLAKGLLTMVSVLVIACPCSLGLATPTAVIAGIGKGAESGILIKDADSLQIAKNIKKIVFDKTGTLTKGTPTVTDMFWYDESMKGALKSIELFSEHPLAEAILKTLQDAKEEKIECFKAEPGKGVMASYKGERLFVGNHSDAPSRLAEEWEDQGKTLVYFSGEGRLIAVYAISDELKETSFEAVNQLKTMGIEPVMLTGDNEASARAIAFQVGIDKVKAGVLPGEKAGFVSELQKGGEIVAVAGDGINDSAALARADLGIAMGKGSDIAMDAAMVTIVSSDLSRIPDLVRLSRKSTRIIRQNLFWAFIYNIIAVPAAAGLFGFQLNPMIAAACMALSSVCVVTNSLRLRK